MFNIVIMLSTLDPGIYNQHVKSPRCYNTKIPGHKGNSVRTALPLSATAPMQCELAMVTAPGET
jgi:hypothetical protein